MIYVLLAVSSITMVCAWYLYKSKRGDKTNYNPIINLSDEHVIQLQVNFERRLESDSDLPDGIRGRDAYIYWNCMRDWFAKLSADARYDEEKLQKLRRDWCKYIESVPRLHTERFLSRETEEVEKSEQFERDSLLTSEVIISIQNAFAAAVGEAAVEELKCIRSKPSGAFDRTGKLPMAPDGQRYFPISINPYVEKCKPD